MALKVTPINHGNINMVTRDKRELEKVYNLLSHGETVVMSFDSHGKPLFDTAFGSIQWLEAKSSDVMGRYLFDYPVGG